MPHYMQEGTDITKNVDSTFFYKLHDWFLYDATLG